MGFFLQSTEATPCGHLLKWKLTPENPPADTMFMAAMAMVLPWKIVENFQSFVKKNYETFTLTLKICILQDNGFKRAHIGLVWKLVLRATHSVLQHFWSDHLLEHSEAMNDPQNTFKWPWKISFVNKFKVSFLCIPEVVWPSNFGNCLKMPQG
jgi:hypothetical protein